MIIFIYKWLQKKAFFAPLNSILPINLSGARFSPTFSGCGSIFGIVLRTARKNGAFFGQLFLCLSRACLGKHSVSYCKMAPKRPFSLRDATRVSGCMSCASAGTISTIWRTPLWKTFLFFEFSLCLSRACLGKKIVFIYKWLKKYVFLTRRYHRIGKSQSPTGQHWACERKKGHILVFLIWNNDRWFVKTGSGEPD